MSAITGAIAEGRLSGRLWLYANYHCNLRCSYCLTESGPAVARRSLDPARMLDLAREARALGFIGLGVTGGEPFLVPGMPDLIAGLARVLPVIVLSNGTLFGGRRLAELDALADLPVAVQISLDRPDPVANDEMRGPQNFRRVVEAIPRLVDRGIAVRIATTLEHAEPHEMERLCALHRSLGVPDEDHVVRPIVRRGRAETEGLGVPARAEDLEPELTITADGAFFSPFGPTVRGGRIDTDLLVTRTTTPLSGPADVLVRIVDASPAGHDARLGIR